MKTLYNVISEGILDDQDDVMDKMTDDVIEATGQRIADLITNGKFNAKTKTIKAANGNSLCITTRGGKICFFTGSRRNYTPLDEVASLVDLKEFKFDCDVSLYLDAVEMGFTLDNIQWVGRQHILHIHQMENGTVDAGMIQRAVGNSNIPPQSALMLNTVNIDKAILNNEICARFDAVQVQPDRWALYSGFDELKDCTANKLIISNVREWLEIDNKCKTMSDAIKAASNAYTKSGYSSSYSAYRGDHKKSLTTRLKELIANNPGTSFIMCPGFLNFEYVDKDLNCRKLTGLKYWTKI